LMSLEDLSLFLSSVDWRREVYSDFPQISGGEREVEDIKNQNGIS
jgi:hypothetical protein